MNLSTASSSFSRASHLESSRGIYRQPDDFAGEAESGAHHVGVDAAVRVERLEFRSG
jgi:hypothetical protein